MNWTFFKWKFINVHFILRLYDKYLKMYNSRVSEKEKSGKESEN